MKIISQMRMHPTLSCFILCFERDTSNGCSEPTPSDWALLDKSLQTMANSGSEKDIALNLGRVPKFSEKDGPIIWGDKYDDAMFSGDAWRDDLRTFLPLTYAAHTPPIHFLHAIDPDYNQRTWRRLEPPREVSAAAIPIVVYDC